MKELKNTLTKWPRVYFLNTVYGFCICIDSDFMCHSSSTAAFDEFNTLPTQRRHIEHMHEGVWLFKPPQEIIFGHHFNSILFF